MGKMIMDMDMEVGCLALFLLACARRGSESTKNLSE
jgi:hypothetical protein